LFDCVVN